MALLSTKLPWDLAQTKWSATLNPIIATPFLSGTQISSVILKANKAQPVNHLLQRMPQGWFLTDNIANTVVWRTQPFTDLTITLESSADTTISFWVF